MAPELQGLRRFFVARGIDLEWPGEGRPPDPQLPKLPMRRYTCVCRIPIAYIYIYMYIHMSYKYYARVDLFFCVSHNRAGLVKVRRCDRLLILMPGLDCDSCL